MLDVLGLTKRFGGLVAVDHVDFQIGEGEIVGLIGPNGAGKTTLFNTLAGIYEPDEGVVMFNGKDITGMKPDKICTRGIARTFQNVRTFNESNVLENVAVGALFGSGRSLSMNEARAEAREQLSFVGLEDKAELSASSLTIADRKHVELASALATQPDLVMLDEIATGLNPSEVDVLSDTIKRVRDEYGISVFWIEHIMDAIMGTTDRIITLNKGQKLAEGTPAEIQQNEAVGEAYLGAA